jgi:hypothetical protein
MGPVPFQIRHLSGILIDRDFRIATSMVASDRREHDLNPFEGEPVASQKGRGCLNSSTSPLHRE